MIDFDYNEASGDLEFIDTELFKAKNILETQIESLVFLKDFGIDINYFFANNISFPINAVVLYCQERLMSEGISIDNLDIKLEDFILKVKVKIGKE